MFESNVMDRLMMKRLILLVIVIILFLVLAACSEPAVVKPSNHAPVIENVLYPRDAFGTGEAQIRCVANDDDGDALAYQWSAAAGEIKGEGPMVVWFPPAKMGTYQVSVVVTDGKGGRAEHIFEIRVVTNADGTATPQIEIKLKLGDDQPVILNKQRARVWTTTEIICVVEDASADQLTYKWSASGGKIAGKDVNEGKAGMIGWIAPGVAGDYSIDVIAADNNGRQAKAQINMNVFCCGN